MAYDEGLADILRQRLAPQEGVSERKMFGGLCLMVNGNMACGTNSRNAGGGFMFRVGPDREAAALALPSVERCVFTGRPMKGFVEINGEICRADEPVATLVKLACEFAGSLPAK